jgi:5'-AMP-activated protein kinase regulatory gamma subunit
VGPDDTLQHVVDELLSQDVAQLPVLHYPAHALVPELLHLACLSGVLKCMFHSITCSLPVVSSSVSL